MNLSSRVASIRKQVGRCSCGEVRLTPGVTAIWADGRHHTADECHSEGEGAS